jgi:hypothetical protein
MGETETQLLPCPICGKMPKVESFQVGPKYGGGIAWGVWCDCGLGEGVAYRDRSAAIECWNAYVGDGWEVE